MLSFPTPSPPVALVGRDREQATLRAARDRALAGQGGLVLIGGEAGIGKTALAETICEEAKTRGALVLVGRCYDLTETPPYGPWVELFGHYHQDDGLPPSPPAFAQRGTVGAVTSEAALHSAVHEFFAAVAGMRPLVLLLDDLHWADPASLGLLRFLARQTATAPILILATYRSDELTRRHPLYALHPLLVREAHATRIDLKPLAADDVRVLVETRYALPEADAASLVTYLTERSEGNAFFIGELLRGLEEEGALRATEDGWAVRDLTQSRVPTLLKQVIDARLTRLGVEAQRSLSVAAIIGQEVPLDLWLAVAETDEETASETIERAAEAHIVEASGNSIRFAHALIREALYESIPAIRRWRLHLRVADALTVTRNPDPDMVAYHFQQAGDTRATTWLVSAGQRARHAYAFITATARYEAALSLMERDGPDADERLWVSYLLAMMYSYTAWEKGVPTLNDVIDAATAAGNRTLAAIARFQRGLLRRDSLQAKLVDMTTAIGVLETLPDSDIAQIRGHLGADYSVDADRAALVRMLVDAGRFTEVQALAEHLVGEGQDARTYPYGTGAYALMMQAAFRGDPASARRWAAAAHAALRASGMALPLLAVMLGEMDAVHLAYAADDPVAGARLLQEAEETEQQASEVGLFGTAAALSLGLLLLEGAWSTAKERARDLLPRQKSPIIANQAATWLAVLARCQGEYELATEYVAMVLPIGAMTDPGDDAYIRALQVQRVAAGVALDKGDLATARGWMEAHDRWLAWSGAVLGQSEGQALWAQYYRQAGDIAKAHEHAENALVHATEPRQPLALIAAHRLLGELDTEAGRYDDAARHLGDSLRLADACAAPYERALTLLAMAELQAATSDRAEARTLLDEVQMICTRLGANPALARADALAARLDATPPAAPVYPAGLSAREVEVLHLVAQGLTNPQVAERLYLSPRTVEQHLRSIYNKVGVSTRAAAAAFAVSHGLM